MLSNSCKYAIRAIIYLALKEENNKRIGIKEIATELDIPSPFLGKILQILAKNKILKSIKGPNGGFYFAKRPNEITLLSIIEIIDGLDFLNNLLIGLRSCSANNNYDMQCPLHEKYEPISKQIYELFSSETIESIKLKIITSGETIAL